MIEQTIGLPLSNKLVGLRQRLFEYTLKLTVAARASDREMLHEAQASIDKAWVDWDEIIKGVAELEIVYQNNVAALAICQEDNE